MEKVDPARLAQAVVRLGGDADWNCVLDHVEAQYEVLKEQLVTCSITEQETLKGRAQAFRQLRDEFRNARSRLQHLEANKRQDSTFRAP